MALTPNPNFADRALFLQPNTQRDRAGFRAPIRSEAVNFNALQISADIALLYKKYDDLTIMKDQAMAAFTQDGFTNYSAIADNLEQYALDLKRIRNNLEVLKKVMRNV